MADPIQAPPGIQQGTPEWDAWIKKTWGATPETRSQLYGDPNAAKPVDDPRTMAYANQDLVTKDQKDLLAGNTSGYEAQSFGRSLIEGGGQTTASDPSKYFMNGDPKWASGQNDVLQGNATAAEGRAAPTIDTSAMNPYIKAASGASAGLGKTAAGLGKTAGALGTTAGALSGVAGSQDVQGQRDAAGLQIGAGQQQMGAGDALMKLGQMPAGPSAAELAMRQQSDSNIAAQSAMAAGARGGNVGLAGMNAAANQAQIGGQETAQIGVQRAQEDMANRQFSANTIGQAGQTYGAAGSTIGGAGQTLQGAAGTQISALSGAASAQEGQASTLGTQANAYGNQGQLNTGLAAQQGQIATDNAGNALKQTQLNDTRAAVQQGMGYGLVTGQTNDNMAYDSGRADRAAGIQNSTYANRDRSGEGTITGSAGGDKLLAAGTTTTGTMLAMSDIRAKTRIAPGGEHIDNTFRSLGGYGYDYADPSAPGAAPGRHFGPMAQELEQTPAGASAVVQKPNGTKGVDTGRLALVNASETARLRQELDALKGGQPLADRIRGLRVRYPGDPDVQLPEQRVAASVPPTPLFYGGDNGGTFRTPDEQIAYSRSLGARTEATPSDRATGADQYHYASAAPPAEQKREEKIATLAADDAAKEDQLKKWKEQLGPSLRAIGSSLPQSSNYAPPQQFDPNPPQGPVVRQSPIAFGY